VLGFMLTLLRVDFGHAPAWWTGTARTMGVAGFWEGRLGPDGGSANRPSGTGSRMDLTRAVCESQSPWRRPF